MDSIIKINAMQTLFVITNTRWTQNNQLEIKSWVNHCFVSEWIEARWDLQINLIQWRPCTDTQSMYSPIINYNCWLYWNISTNIWRLEILNNINNPNSLWIHFKINYSAKFTMISSLKWLTKCEFIINTGNKFMHQRFKIDLNYP